ncbi:hypothetical protein GCM10011416_09470 [Polaribacter pacificus]|uniref:Uncharacterized protein n=1 Tax=Polaribacter pacificus TaxID=1775173 RepID=A0A917MCX2_9FLAO|nr:hypothetical protein [Polaribacter pacificus]GGG94257.1 hypothetical protein GCM10011416_09470 [Polaribacter pacificus]
MEAHWTLSDAQFEDQFTFGTFKPLWFSHEAHLRLAWMYITKYGVQKAFEMYKSQLLAFAVKHLAKNKFNLTVTYASIKVVAGYCERSNSSNFKDFLQEFPELKTNFKELLSAHYSINIFSDSVAKQQILEPDLVPF